MDALSQQQTPPQQTVQPSQPIKNSSSAFLKTLSLGLGVVGIGILIGIGGYFLGARNNQTVSQSVKTLQCKTDFDCADDNVCTDDSCIQGVCNHTNSTEGKSCGANLPDQGQTNFCNGAGKCVYYGPVQQGPLKEDRTVNWKTYISVKGGFSIKYPGSWPLVNAPLPNDPSAPLDDIVFSPNYKENSGDSSIAFITAAKQRVQTLNQYLNTLKQDSSIVDIKETILGGEKAVSYKRTGGMGTPSIIEYAVFKNGTMYDLVLYDSLETNKNRETNIAIFDQILSTFRFVEDK